MDRQYVEARNIDSEGKKKMLNSSSQNLTHYNIIINTWMKRSNRVNTYRHGKQSIPNGDKSYEKKKTYAH